jgi:hypothetical protein
MISSLKESQAQFCTDKQHPRKKKKKQQQQNGSSKHSAAAAAATAGFKQGQRRKQLHMTKLEKEVEANGPSVFEFGDWKPGARY